MSECEGCGKPCESDNSNRRGLDRDNSELCLCNDCKEKAQLSSDELIAEFENQETNGAK